jgi:glycosyltransferase involved in cell wall biosynthesis
VRVLIVTRIFPSSEKPSYAPYNRRQFGELAKLCDVEVWGLVPRFPLQRLVTPGSVPSPPRSETIDDLVVQHPRVLYAPRLGRPLSGALYTASLAPSVFLRRGELDLLMGSFAYPDGWAAAALGQMLGIPAVIQVLGSDLNVYGEDPLLRPNLRWACRRAAAVVGPSQQLIDKAVALGAPAETSRMIPNGIDGDTFHLRDRTACRAALGHGDDRRRWILCVGRLEPAKGLWELLDAFEEVHRVRGGDTQLVLVGDGVDADKCREHIQRRDLPVLMAGVRPDVATWCGACDLLTLPSWREGTPNVVLEALASGRPVVATDVGGIPDVVNHARLGRLVPPRRPRQLAEALLATLDDTFDPEEVVAQAKLCTWADSAKILHQVLERVHRAHAG